MKNLTIDTNVYSAFKNNDQQVIETYYESSITVGQLAEQLGRPTNTLYKALQRIRLRLFHCIERRLAASS